MLHDRALDSEFKPSDASSEDIEEKRRESIIKDRRESVTRVNADINDTFSPDLKNINEASRTTRKDTENLKR